MICPNCNIEQAIIGTATFGTDKQFVLGCRHKFTQEELDKAANPLYETMMQFQKTGVQFGKSANYRFLCADDMGLGKTVQALMCLREDYELLTPTLIIVKSGLLHNWLAECLYWLGNPKLNEPKQGFKYRYEPDWSRVPQILTTKTIPLPNTRIFICSMDSLEKVTGKLITAGIKVKCVIVDESHNFKNLKSKRTQILRRFILGEGIPHLIFLSGTPITNNVREYFPTLNLLKPAYFPTESSFLRQWVNTWGNKPKGLNPYMKDKFFALTNEFIIRRTRDEVLKEQPKFRRIPEFVDFDDPAFIKLYKAGQKSLQEFMKEHTRRNSKHTIELLALLAKLRHACGMAKVKHTADKAKEFLDSEETAPKLLIGVHHHNVGNSLVELLKDYGAQYLIGGMDAETRSKLETRFREDPDCKVMVASTLAAGEGLNFQFAHTAFQVERQWNTAREIQFEGRINRIGQKHPMTFYYFMIKDSIDEWLHNLIEEKFTWTESALNADFDPNSEATINLWDLADKCL